MTRRLRVIAVAAIAAMTLGVGAGTSFAGRPGPGDKQCIPGQQGSPKPAHKAGACPNP